LRYLIISDIHGNLEALTAVLADAGERSVDEVICLGDFVGYGANPSECVEEFMALPKARAVLGNHDAAVLDPGQRELFNPVARAGVLFSEANLSERGREYLRTLPMKIDVDSEFLAVHSSPFRPEAWIYVVEPLEAADAFHVMKPALAFIGHTHFPAVHADNGSVLPLAPEDRIKVNSKNKIMVNVGSVGQPRDGDARAAYVIYDSESSAVRMHRVEYDIDQAAAKILEAGLPPMLADRLRRGY
jgi:diadenosine tetraphosphatase ApaH/serine/threonine PP2A family protein phosphatase